MLRNYEIIQHDGEDWSFLVDPSHVPAYLVIRLAGLVPETGAFDFRRSVVRCFQHLVMAGFSNCPVIVDYSLLDNSNWSIAHFSKVHGGVFKPSHRLVVILSNNKASDPLLQNALIVFASTVWRNISFVNNFAEAVAALTPQEQC